MNSEFKKDLDFILMNISPSLIKLKQSSIFITGATGFFGKWLLATLQWANHQGNYQLKITALSRNPHAFVQAYPSLAQQITFIQGDITDFAFPKQQYDYIIHAATEASAQLNDQAPAIMLNTIIAGMQRILQFADYCGAKRILHTSSGAVYGVQPPAMSQMCENYLGAPTIQNSTSAYAEGKRVAELLGVIHAQQSKIELVNARCFAFVGLYLPLTTHFAIGNFIYNGLNKQPIIIKGDGTPKRSYLYAAELMIWLLTILTQGKNSQAYNVGSDMSYSIVEIAQLVQRYFPASAITILQPAIEHELPARYVPNIDKARSELGLNVTIDLALAIEKTIIQTQYALFKHE